MIAPSTASAFTTHLISRLEADLAFLHSQQLLSEADLGLIKSKLADAQRQADVQAGVAGLAVAPTAPRNVPPPPPPDDLAFKSGDIITIEEEVNADWWKGSLNGQTGLFPANHVERVNSAPSPVPPPPPLASGNGYDVPYSQPAQQKWTPPPPPSAGPTYAYQQPQYYGSEKPYNAPPPPPQQIYVSPQAAPGPEEAKKNKFGKFGGKMGTAVASGAGFGLGAGLMSEAVHGIFN
ncbi:class E vacuolar protein-sorting machinery protein hse2 [Rhodotorula toruloides]|uniref:Class E vacuolar protein-sorting machinery protein hse2 n=1 Tax=Rhodotorula toruloides TaxID=5286 RepID=A0A511KLM1_RHOTO|nr:class E vacuolar protein-sorting machinery protein hse2 [Rhodotorula toruloides]